MKRKNESQRRKRKTPDDWQRQILVHARQQRSRRKRPKPKTDISKLYDNLKQVTFRKDAHPEQFFAIPKTVLEMEMSATAKSIYPVLVCLSDFEKPKQFQVSVKNIGTYSGLSDWSTVKKGLDELKELELIEGEKVHQQRRYWIYDVQFIRKVGIEEYEFSEWLPFHGCIVKTGAWSRLTPKVQSVYLALRSGAKFEYDTGAEYHSDYLSGHITFEEIYKERKYESYTSSWAELAERSGVSYGYLKKAIKELEFLGLCSWDEFLSAYGCIVNIYLRPLETDQFHYGDRDLYYYEKRERL